MNPDVQQALVNSLHFGQVHHDKHARATKLLAARGFRQAGEAGAVRGRVCASHVGTYGYDLLFFRADDIQPARDGYHIEQTVKSARFVVINDGITYTDQDGLALFIPRYLLEAGGIFVNSEIPDGEQTAKHFRHRLRYETINEGALLEEEAGLYQGLVALIARKRLPLDDYMTQVRERAVDNGIKVEMAGRQKSPAELYILNGTAIERRQTGEIPDVNTILVLTDTIEHCYALLDIIHGVVPVRMAYDTIGVPTWEGDQRLRTAARDIGLSLEFQVTTKAMHERARDRDILHAYE